MFKILMYGVEERQFRNKVERKQALELFCYPIGLFDFAKTKKLVEEAFLYTQARSLMKSAAWLGIPFNDIEFEKLLKVYYEKEIKTEKDWIDIKDRLDKFYKSCLL